MKILLSAYACEPNRGSEPGLGWRWALEIAVSPETGWLFEPGQVGSLAARVEEAIAERSGWKQRGRAANEFRGRAVKENSTSRPMRLCQPTQE